MFGWGCHPLGTSEAVKERHPFKDGLKPVMKRWDTVEKGIQYLREIAVVEMLYDPNFVPNHPCQDHDPESEDNA